MPVFGRAAKSSAMMFAEPRRNAYGDAAIRPTRIGISHDTRPSWASMICCTGSARSCGGDQKASSERCDRSRRDRPNRYRSARGGAGRRRDAKPASRSVRSTAG
jgi:hypothetical protein